MIGLEVTSKTSFNSWERSVKSTASMSGFHLAVEFVRELAHIP